MKKLPKDWVLRVTKETLPFINKVRSKQCDYNDNITLEEFSPNYYPYVHNFESFVCGGFYEFRSNIEIDLETFKQHFIKEEKEIKLTRGQLVDLYYSDDCSEWKEKIENILRSNFLVDDFVIPQYSIDCLIERGSDKQKKLVRDLGIYLPMSEFDKYIIKHNECELKEGDNVRVMRKFHYGENGVNFSHLHSMNDYIGEICEIRTKGTNGYNLKYNDDYYTFPYFVLEKVEYEYVPYTFEDNLIGMTVIHNKVRYLILSQSNFGVHMLSLDRTYEELLKDCKHTDGTPFGKLVNK